MIRMNPPTTPVCSRCLLSAGDAAVGSAARHFAAGAERLPGAGANCLNKLRLHRQSPGPCTLSVAETLLFTPLRDAIDRRWRVNYTRLWWFAEDSASTRGSYKSPRTSTRNTASGGLLDTHRSPRTAFTGMPVGRHDPACADRGKRMNHGFLCSAFNQISQHSTWGMLRYHQRRNYTIPRWLRRRRLAWAPPPGRSTASCPEAYSTPCPINRGGEHPHQRQGAD